MWKRYSTAILSVLAIMVLAGVMWIIADPGWRIARANLWFDLHYGDRVDIVLDELYKKLDGRHVPDAIDRLLIDEFNRAGPGTYRAMIVEFYAKQAGFGGRQGDRARTLGPPLIEAILENHARWSQPAKRGGLILMEEARTNEYVSKRFLSVYEDEPDVVYAHYETWWRKPLPWEEKRLYDPLYGTDVKWLSP